MTGSAGRRLRVRALVTLPTLGPGNRLRVEQYVPQLRASGIDVEVSAFFDEAAYSILYRTGNVARKALAVARGVSRRLLDLWNARRYDLFIVHRESAPLGPPLLERALTRMGIPFVFDFDDAIFLGAIHPANRQWAWLRHPSRVAETARRARSIVVSTEYLAAWARSHNSDVTVIPTPVDTDRFRPIPGTAGSGGPVLGWVGSSTTAPFLRLLDDVFTGLAERGISVRVVGGKYEHPAVPVDLRPYDLAREPLDVASFSVGLLPQTDDAWTKGKMGFKALVYMATGIPVVASRAGVNCDVVVDGETGFCAATTGEWIAAISRLLDDSELRTRMGRAGRERVERLYSLRVQAPRLAAVLRAAARSDG